MVNDFNQDLCGGWFRDDIEDEDGLIAERVANGLKPLGNLGVWDSTSNAASKLDAIANQLEGKGLRTKRYVWTSSLGGQPMHLLDCCQPGTLGELFDLDSLAYDYDNFLPAEHLGEEIRRHASVRLDSFLGDKWDDLRWLTGLMLGYPIENTMSRCYGHVKPIRRKAAS